MTEKSVSNSIEWTDSDGTWLTLMKSNDKLGSILFGQATLEDLVNAISSLPFDQRAALLLEVGKIQKESFAVTVNGSEISDILRKTAELREKISSLESELVIEKARYTVKTVALNRADKLIGAAKKRAEQSENTVKELRLLNAEKKRAHEDAVNAVTARCEELENKLATSNTRERELRDLVSNLKAQNKILADERNERLGNVQVNCKSEDRPVMMSELMDALNSAYKCVGAGGFAAIAAMICVLNRKVGK